MIRIHEEYRTIISLVVGIIIDSVLASSFHIGMGTIICVAIYYLYVIYRRSPLFIKYPLIGQRFFIENEVDAHKNIKKERQQQLFILVVCIGLFLFMKDDDGIFHNLIGLSIFHYLAYFIITFFPIPSRELVIEKHTVTWMVDTNVAQTIDVLYSFRIENNRIILMQKEEGIELSGLRIPPQQQAEITTALEALQKRLIS